MSEGLNTLAKGNRMLFDGTNALYVYALDYSDYLGMSTGTVGVPIVALGIKSPTELQFMGFDDDERAQVVLEKATGTPGEVGDLDHGIAVGGRQDNNVFQIFEIDNDGNLRVAVATDADSAVELKDASADNRADINDASTARTTTTHVLAVQHIDAAGDVLPSGLSAGINNASYTMICDEGGDVASISPSNELNVLTSIGSKTRLGDGTNMIGVMLGNVDIQTNNTYGLVVSSRIYGYAGTDSERVFMDTGVASQALRIAPPNDARFIVSKDANANAAANALYVELVDGSGNQVVTGAGPAVDGLRVAPPSDAYMPVSKNAAINAANNALLVQLSDGSSTYHSASPQPVTVYDASGTYQLDVRNVTGSNVPTNVHALWTASTIYGYNQTGTTNTPIQVSSSGAIHVMSASTGAIVYTRSTDGSLVGHMFSAGADAGNNTLSGPLAYTRLNGFNGTTWDRIRSTSGAMNIDITSQSLTAVKISKDASANATGNRIFVDGNIDQVGGSALALGEAGETASVPVVLASDKYVRVSKDTNINATANRIFVSSNVDQVAGSTLSATNPLFCELTDGANVISQTNPLTVQIGDSSRSVDIQESISDALPVSTNALVTASAILGYNGVSLSMLRVGATKELQVTDVATRPGEDSGNDWRKVKKEQVAVVTPAKTTTTVDALEDILASREVLSDPGFTVYVKNTGAAALTALIIETSPDGSSGWVALPTAVAAGYAGLRLDGWVAALGAGALACYSILGNTYRYIRVQANCGTSTTVDCWYVANKQ